MIRVQTEDFDVTEALASLGAEEAGAGAVASFVGLVRGTSPQGPLTAMTIEHYPGMTERALAQLEADARARWCLAGVVMIHRVGRLQPGERIVLVATASPHRDAAFTACRFLIDALKTRAPFWKAEETARGQHWVEARAEDNEAARRWQTGSEAEGVVTL